MADAGMGRRRQYCRQSCRQRAYEQRAMVKGTALAPDAVVLSADEAAALQELMRAVVTDGSGGYGLSLLAASMILSRP